MECRQEYRMDVRTVLNKNRFKLQDIVLGVSLLSDACSGETWFHQWLTQIWSQDEHWGPLPYCHSMFHVDEQVWPHHVYSWHRN